MYAIIKTGGKQYKVQVGDVLDVEKLEVEAKKKVEFAPLMISDEKGAQVGTPEVAGVKVVAEVVEHGKGDKLNIFVYKKKNTHHKAQGHRQPYTKIKIVSIGK